jgi:hypothetical protein
MEVREVCRRALSLLGVVSPGETPAADELADALSSYNAMIASMRGHGIGPALRPMRADRGHALVGGLHDESALATPTDPSDGARFGVSGACSVTTDRAIENGTVTVPTVWFFRADQNLWIVEADAIESDEPQFPAEFHLGLAAMLALRLPDFGAEPSQSCVVLAEECRSNMTQRYRPRINPGVDPALLRLSRQPNRWDWQ